MKLFHKLFAAAVAMVMAVPTVSAQTVPVKNEMRSAWVATMTKDWPKSTSPHVQMNEMIELLDSLKANNMNAICLQVRSECDAIYPSSYEPWAQVLTGKRGTDPGYDPLAFAVEEAHKRGLEFHAWINPYRYESSKNKYGEADYRKDHPEWLLTGTTGVILNPGMPEVRQRVCDVIKEIVTKYDIDGVLFDDYFYLPEGTPLTLDVDLYNAYKAAGGSGAQQDWRRENVNQMVREVNNTIKAVKPWVRFGIGPAGVPSRSQSVCNKYGVTACPVGADWAYSKIFCDPLAWLYNKSIDYISPQIYWKIGSSSDYEQLTRWWSNVADKFGRHLYVSQSLEDIDTWGFDEMSDQVKINRKYTLNKAPGSIFFSSKYLFTSPDKTGSHLHNTVFTTPAIVPAMTWVNATDPGTVANIGRSGGVLTWTAMDNMRYTVYAVPAGSAFNKEANYLLGVTYTASFELPANRLAGYDYYVCPLDRYGNEWSASTIAKASQTLDAPVLTSPADGSDLEMPFTFTWNAVANAKGYVLAFANDAAMKEIVFTTATAETSLEATGKADSPLRGLPVDRKLYWQVIASAPGYNDAASASRAITPRNFEVTYPVHNSADVELDPVIKWTFPQREVLLEVATSEDFTARTMVISRTVTGGSYDVLRHTLAGKTKYYVRVTAGNETSPVVAFTTKFVRCGNPGFKTPSDGGTWFSNEPLAVEPVQGASEVRVELSASATNWSARSIYFTTTFDRETWLSTKHNTAAEIKINSKNMVHGQTYYARIRASYIDEKNNKATNEYSSPISFTYSSEAGVDGVISDSTAPALTVAGNTLSVVADGYALVRLYDAGGRLVCTLMDGALSGYASVELPALTPGLYMATLNGSHAIKVVIK